MDYLPHEADNQDEFIHFAFNYYRHKRYWDWANNVGEGVIEWLYKLGRDYLVLFMDYEEFKRIILGTHKGYSSFNGIKYFKRYDRRRYYGSYSHYCDIKEYRVLKGFTYNGQSKKNKNANDWWEYKGFTRDRRRTSYFQRGWKGSLKHFNKRKHRQLEREAISSERYDKLHSQSWKIEDPWSWD